YFTAKSAGKATIRLTSINGKQVYFKDVKVHAGENSIPIVMYSNLLPGVYIVTVAYDKRLESVRIVKE
ncbi:MAG TPA: T9SS type A sorting domain-containing protein, partial [Pontibacter sp.]